MSRLVGSRSCAIFQSSCDRNSFLRFHLCTQDPPTIRGAHATRRLVWDFSQCDCLRATPAPFRVYRVRRLVRNRVNHHRASCKELFDRADV